MDDVRLIPAAQYLRMSTEHQQYSLVGQESAIKRYSEEHGFTVVRKLKAGRCYESRQRLR
jgi:DNA invertase Pin-like site-specific DNA recombinase